MQLITILTSALLSATALAFPTQARTDSKTVRADATQWTIESTQRVCNTADTSCTWTFGVNNGTGTTACTEVVTGSPASEANGGPATCGVYTVTSGWSGQFGAGNGFTTFAVVNNAAGLIVFPAYTDTQVAGGAVVIPDQSYTPQAL